MVSSVVSGVVLGHGRWEDLGGPSVAFLMRGWVWPAPSDGWVFLLLGGARGAGGFFISAAYRGTDAALMALALEFTRRCAAAEKAVAA
jgi:hypothetical protein